VNALKKSINERCAIQGRQAVIRWQQKLMPEFLLRQQITVLVEQDIMIFQKLLRENILSER